MSKNTIIAILDGAVGMFVLLVIAGMMMEEEPVYVAPTYNTTQTPNYLETPNTSDKLGATARADFMTGCTEGDIEWNGYCGCAYDWLDNNFTNDAFGKIIEDYNLSGDLPQELYQADAACASLAPPVFQSSLR